MTKINLDHGPPNAGFAAIVLDPAAIINGAIAGAASA